MEKETENIDNFCLYICLFRLLLVNKQFGGKITLEMVVIKPI